MGAKRKINSLDAADAAYKSRKSSLEVLYTPYEHFIEGYLMACEAYEYGDAKWLHYEEEEKGASEEQS